MVKILASHFQILSSLEFTLEIPWPSVFVNFNLSLAFVNLDMFEIVPAGCLVSTNYYLKFIASVTFPAVILVLVMVIAWYLAKHHARKGNAKASNAARDSGWKTFFFITYLIYPSVSAEVLRIFACQRIVSGTGSTYFLRADMRYECGDVATLRCCDVAMLRCCDVNLYSFGGMNVGMHSGPHML